MGDPSDGNPSDDNPSNERPDLDAALRRVGEKRDRLTRELAFLDDQLQILLNARNIAIVVLQQD